jgi:xanthine dehydrogenase small subunit
MSSNRITFLLNDKIREVDFNTSNFHPSTTVLNYLRSFSNTKGVKEGCAEGDCGACTIVLGELDSSYRIRYYSADSCLLFLASVHGKQIITVEGLERKVGNETVLHPVQQALIDHFGSQCGFCTPGIVMSIFALYKTKAYPNRNDVVQSLSGNLCRCTGYEPILNAALAVCSNLQPDHFDANEMQTATILEGIKNKQSTISIRTKDQNYFYPETLNEAFDIIDSNPTIKVVNGATDTAIRQNKFYEYLENILDISAVQELKLLLSEPSGYYIGSGITIESLKGYASKHIPTLLPMLDVFASNQIRNVATVGGNLATSSPIGDLIPLLMAHKAKIEIISSSGSRWADIEGFITGYRKNCLIQNELIKGIFIPKIEEGTFVKSFKVSTRHQLDISTLSLSARIELEEDEVKSIILAFGGMAEVPKRAAKTEAFLLNKPWSIDTINKASVHIADDFKPISDARSTVEYRLQAAKNLLLKLL